MTRKILCSVFLAVALPTNGWADADTEIQYLLGYVETSGCLFERNGTEHDATGAAVHLRLKCTRGKRYAKTAEQFIDRLASESSWTGKTYTVTCNGSTEPSGDWLHGALQEYRQAGQHSTGD